MGKNAVEINEKFTRYSFHQVVFLHGGMNIHARYSFHYAV